MILTFSCDVMRERGRGLKMKSEEKVVLEGEMNKTKRNREIWFTKNRATIRENNICETKR